MLVKYSKAFIMKPSSFGTMDELFETLRLMQTVTIRNFLVIALVTSYWNELRPFVEKILIKHKTIDPTGLDLVLVTDDVEEVIEIIKSCE